MTKGILIIAIGQKEYLGMAANLIAGIKYNNPAVQIALATNIPTPPWMAENEMVDQIIEVPAEYYTIAGKAEYIKVKTHMYDLSPFDHTLFLDADQVWLNKRNPEDIFDQLKEIEFTIANTGPAKESIWAKIDEVKKAYKIDMPFYNYHSEFVYFKKCAAVKKYFDKVKSVFMHPKVKATKFGGARMADELAFQIASMLLDYYPHKDNYLPNFWWGRNVGTKEFHQYPYQLPPTYYTYSIGGKITPPAIAKNYNTLASFYFNKMNLAKPWVAKHKMTLIQDRKTI